MRAPTEEEFTAWRSDPTTVWVVELLQKKREELRQAWEGGSFTDYDERTTVLVNVGNLGTCKGYAFFTDMTYETILTELGDEQQRTGATRSGGVDQGV